MAFNYQAGKAGQVEKVVNDTDVMATKSLGLNDLFMQGLPLGGGNGGVDSAYSNSWVAYSCIRALATDASSVPLVFLSDPKDKESHVPESHPTRQLLTHPGPCFSQSEMIQWMVSWQNYRGEFFLPFDNYVRPAEVIPHLDPRYWKDVVDSGMLVGWIYQHGGMTLKYLPSQLINARFINPSKPFRGQSPLQAAARAYGIEVGAEKLSLNIIHRGGEKSMLFELKDSTAQQIEQAAALLAGRRGGTSTVGRDVILPGGLTPLDPKFIDDELSLLDAGAAQPGKITSVYGVPRSRIDFGSEETYANAQVKKRTYYDDTLVPQLSGIESAFDRMFINGPLGAAYRCYVRFDWSSVPAMQDNLVERFAMAGKAHADGLPWEVLNDRFALGLDTSKIPGADTIMVASSQAPLDKLIEEWNTPVAPVPPQDATEPAKSANKFGGLTDILIRKRATNTRSRINRAFRIARMEKAFRAEWKAVLVPVMEKAAKAAGSIKTASGAKAALKPAFKGLGEKLYKVAGPHHEAGALEGELSIIELIDGKISDAALNFMKADHQWSPDVKRWLAQRENLIKGMDDVIFEDVLAAVETSIIEGAESSQVQHVVRERFKSAPGGINRAVTIARTEVGTGYNVARFAEIKNQEFEWHEWLANGDEVTRETHMEADGAVVKVGDDFPGVNMPYPQAPGGPAEEVINCRCETIPALKGPK